MIFYTHYRQSNGKTSNTKIVRIIKKIISTSFNMRGTAFIMRQKPHGLTYIFKNIQPSVVPCMISHHLQFVCFVTK